MASNVRFEVDPPFRSSQDQRWGLPVAQIKLLTSGIPSLAPGKRHVTAFDTLFDREKLGLPTSIGCGSSTRVRTVSASRTPSGWTWICTGTCGPVYRDTIHQVSETLKKIERRMTGWSSSRGGLLVMTPDEVQPRHEDIEAGLAAQSEPNSHVAGNGRARLTGRLLEVTGRLRRRG